MSRRDDYESWFIELITLHWRAVLLGILILAAAAIAAVTLFAPLGYPAIAEAATWQRVSWTNPQSSIDSVRMVQVRAPGDTIARAMYAAKGGATKRVGLPGSVDSAWVSVSTTNRVSGGDRLLVSTHNPAGWGPWSNALTLFYGARDTVYWGPDGWTRGIGVRAWAQAPRDSAMIAWRHQELIQLEVRDRLCAIFGYWALRGARQVCPAPALKNTSARPVRP